MSHNSSDMDPSKLEKSTPSNDDNAYDILTRYPTEQQHPTEEDFVQPTGCGKNAALQHTVSNALSRTYSRITNRDIIDPGPAPDGGVKGWTQVAMAWLVCITTWGYVNSFGVFSKLPCKIGAEANVDWCPIPEWLSSSSHSFDMNLPQVY